jgi:hypothetical protein
MMTELSRRNFGKHTIKWGGALSLLTVLNSPGIAQAFDYLGPLKKNKFLKRDDLGYALKSLFMTYDSTFPYPHKFNETITKAQLRGLEFYVLKGLEKEYVDHYIGTMRPMLKMIKKFVEKEGPDKGLFGMFERTTCSYQLFERINIKPGERSFPCPYMETLGHCKKYLGTFTIEWKDVCNKWCTPIWLGFAKEIGIKISVHPGLECKVKLA